MPEHSFSESRTLEVSEQISLFKEIFRSLEGDISKQIAKGEKFYVLEFAHILRSSHELAQILLEHPEDVIRAAELALEALDFPGGTKNFRVRIANLPHTQELLIQNVRSAHLSRLLLVEGIVKNKSDVRPQIVSARFECPSCGTVQPEFITEDTFKAPALCKSCGYRGKLKLLSKDLVDAQAMVIEDIPEKLESGQQPKRINVLLKEDLVSPLSDLQTNPGSKIKISGWVKEIPITTRTGGKSTRFEYLFEANHVEPTQEDFFMLEFSEEEIAEIREVSKRPDVYDLLVRAIAPSIYGHDRIKEALVLQMLGGIDKQRADSVRTRGDVHILLVGDPGSGKSQLLKRASKVAPKSRYVSGKGASGAGLTASVVRNDFLGGFSLEAGALVLANKGMCLIDEMDKMSNEDTSAMHEALEQQTISISKANIQATLPSQTTVLAAANPKYGRFDSYQNIYNQIDMPPALISRFDLIFVVRDLADPKGDERMATHILGLHSRPEDLEMPLPDQFLRKYFAYARQHMRPRLTEAANEEIKNYYVKMRNQGGNQESVRSIPLTARQLEALVRLAEASAKLRLSEHVTKQDAERAINLLHYCLTQVAADESGQIDIDRITSGVPSSQRSRIYTVKKIIEELEGEIGNKIPKSDIEKRAAEKGISSTDLDEILTKLLRSGDLFEPGPGTYGKLS